MAEFDNNFYGTIQLFKLLNQIKKNPLNMCVQVRASDIVLRLRELQVKKTKLVELLELKDLLVDSRKKLEIAGDLYSENQS